MTMELAVDIMRNLLQTGLLISVPILGTALVVGLAISFVQSITSLQEQTLTFVPKMVTVFLILAATFPWMAGTIIEMTTNLWIQIPVYSR